VSDAVPAPPAIQCRCAVCLQEGDHPDKQYHRELGLFLATLNHEQRRLYAAVEANRIGYGGQKRISAVTRCCATTIARGRRELAERAQGRLTRKARKPIPGRPRIEKQYPAIVAALEAMINDEIAGCPQGEEKWVRSSVAKLTKRLRDQQFPVGHNAVWALLKRMGYSMKTGVRRRRGATRDPSARDEQFRYIAAQRLALGEAGAPIVSVDTKKKELIGNFRNPGRAWCKEAPEVDEHDFPSQAECIATPFGVYDVRQNTGYVVVGLSHNTPEFAVATIARWWQGHGRAAYPDAHRLVILADGGGANGCRARAWKWNLQAKLCDRFGLTVTVHHYPPGCSKWNPVEHRLFSQISKNWEGRPLRSLAVMLGYIRGTTTTTGLSVTADLDEATYKKGQKVAKEDLKKVNLQPHDVCPDWNYTITPSQTGEAPTTIKGP
jgi:hypothetical protein